MAAHAPRLSALVAAMTTPNGVATITDFLNARVNEIQRRVEVYAKPGLAEKLRDRAGRVARLYGDADPPEGDLKPADVLWFTAQDAAAWIDQVPPARVLVWCESMRKLIELHVITVTKDQILDSDDGVNWRYVDRYEATCAVCGWASNDRTSACETLRLCAAALADHPEYRSEWAP